MKGLNKLVLVSAIVAASAANAELKSIDDAAMAEVSGQSGIVIEAGFGTLGGADKDAVDAGGATGQFYDLDWSNAGITIEAFKWIVDIEGGWDNVENTGANTPGAAAAAGVEAFGGFIAKDIAVAGKVDMTIDATADESLITAGDLADNAGGIGITFAGSDINFKVGDMGVFVESNAALGVEAQQVSSFGGIELIGMNIDKLNLVIRGNGL